MKEKTKISLVTGASSGLGREIAKLLCEKGHITYVVARRKEKLLELKQECKNLQGEIRVIDGDLTDSKFREKLIGQALKESKRIDYLINNAGYGSARYFEKQDLKDIESMFNLNVIAGEHLIQLVLPSMKKQRKGKIINVSSMASFSPTPYFATYDGTKAAISLYSQALNFELSGTGVFISVLFPSMMETGFANSAVEKKSKTYYEKGVTAYNKHSKSPKAVATSLVKNINRKKVFIFPTFDAKLLYFASRHFPRTVRFFTKKIISKKMKEVMSENE